MKLTHRAGMLLGAAALTAAMTGPALAAPALAQSPGNTIHSGYATNLAVTFIPATKPIIPPGSSVVPATKPIIPPKGSSVVPAIKPIIPPGQVVQAV